MEFESGVSASIITSFDVWKSELPRIEIYGTEGSLSVPDPNTFGGPVRLSTMRNKEYVEIPMAFGFSENSRGIGVADMAASILNNSDHRANGELAYHVLELMHAFHLSSEQDKFVKLQSMCKKPTIMDSITTSTLLGI
jgi:predicted dehydrogenase